MSSPFKLPVGAQAGSHTPCDQAGMKKSPFFDNTIILGVMYNPVEGARNPSISDFRILENTDNSDFSCSPVLQISASQGKP